MISTRAPWLSTGFRLTSAASGGRSGLMAMDHQYIDANAVAQRYLVNRLRIEEREDFERHLVDCQECTDRILLAGMFHARSGNGVRAIHEATQPVTQDADPSPSPREFNGQGELGESPQSKSARELKTP